MGARFVVRVGRRWRELDLISGRVSGLGDVRLVRVRRGKLEVVPRAPALRALRTLLTAGSKRSAAKDGPRLSQIRYLVNPRRSKGREERQTDGHKKAPPPVHTCCQQHHYQCITDANFNSILRPPTSTVGVQCSGQAPAAPTLNTHTDSITDLREHIHTNNQSHRVKDHGSEKLPNKNLESEEPRNKDHGGERIKRRTLLGRKRQTQESVGSVNAVAAVSEARPTEHSRREPLQAKVLKNLNQESLSSDSEFESGIGKNKLQRNKGPDSKGERRRDHGRKALAKRNHQTQEGPCKELLISEETVMLLRGFIERDHRNVFGVDLELYDTDDAYKAQFFYRLNPLVNLERCPQISRMLRERASQADTVSLKDFITKLGLRSVAESSGGQSRYRMRRRSDVTARRRASSEPDKENRGQTQRDRSLAERKRSRKDNKLTTNNQAEPAPSHTKPNTGDSSRNELKEVASNGGEKEKRPGKPATGKLVAKREYSHEEDEFIVRWVRGEGRAKFVNGNRLWVQLQPQHHAGTGCFRSWHSLRNHYLRYLLPALGALPLPPAEAARLRAAAAAGSLKARKQPARRNSAFQQPPVRSAWARRPRPPPPPQDTVLVSDTEETQKRALRSNTTLTHTHTADRTPLTHTDAFTRTPTYSELTKRFARRHRSTPDTDTVAPTHSDTTDTSDTRAPHTRHRIRYSSESDSGQTPKRRTTRLSVQNGRHDDTDKRHRHSEKTGRNDKTKRRSKSLDSDTDSLLNKRTRSGRRDTSADKSDRPVNNSGRVADKRGSNKRKRNASLDSDTDSRSNKRRRSTRLDSSVRADSGRQNGRTKQMPSKRRSKSSGSDTDTSLYSSSNSEKSVYESGRQRAEETKRNESGQRANKSVPRRDKSGRFTHTTDRQNGNVRGGGKDDSTHNIRQRLNADRIMSKNYQNSEKSDRNDRQQRSGRHKDGHSEGGRLADRSGRLADRSGRHKPRARRLYNPNAI